MLLGEPGRAELRWARHEIGCALRPTTASPSRHRSLSLVEGRERSSLSSSQAPVSTGRRRTGSRNSFSYRVGFTQTMSGSSLRPSTGGHRRTPPEARTSRIATSRPPLRSCRPWSRLLPRWRPAGRPGARRSLGRVLTITTGGVVQRDRDRNCQEGGRDDPGLRQSVEHDSEHEPPGNSERGQRENFSCPNGHRAASTTRMVGSPSPAIRPIGGIPGYEPGYAGRWHFRPCRHP